MSHRGPDAMGTWHDAGLRVGLGHRRLSILDLTSAGKQPMSNEDDTVWLSYNGEIYDFDEHRQELISRGHRFKSATDSEVLLHLYEEHGLSFLERLNGIFALALWDSRQKQLLLARDHAGVKPLYYWRDGPRLFFASEIKALLSVPELPRRLNRAAVPHYLRFLWVPGEQTMLESVQKLEPGHLLVWRDGAVSTRRWFSMTYEPDERVTETQWVDRVHDTMNRVVQRQMVADVPLGAFLSGGLDSSAIVACMRRTFPDRPIVCYTVKSNQQGDDQFADDYPYAQRVARDLNVTLETVQFEPDALSLLPRMIWHLDEPDADPAVIPSYLICRSARESGTTVLLSGTGGDEVFFGYRSHQAYRGYSYSDRLPRGALGAALTLAARGSAMALGAGRALPRRLLKFRRGMVERGLARHLAIVDWSDDATRGRLFTGDLAAAAPPDDVPACMRRYYDAFVGEGEINRHSDLLLQTFLAAHNFLYTDKSSMATSIEVRVPFLDVELLRLCATIPERYKLQGRTTKHVLKRAMERELHHDVIYRSKTGFGAPLRHWIRTDLDPLIQQALSPARLRSRGLFRADAVKETIDRNRAGVEDNAYLLYALLTLELWTQLFVDGESVESLGAGELSL